MTKIKTYPCKPSRGKGFIARDSCLVLVAIDLLLSAIYPVIPAKAGIQTANAVGDAGERGRPARKGGLARDTLILASPIMGKRIYRSRFAPDFGG